MVWVQLVTLAALLQYFVFGALVGRARGKYGVPAPATTGNEMFERFYRVQMNTLEQLMITLPALWIAAMYASPGRMAAIGAVFVVGRVVYAFGYIGNPKRREIGFLIGAVAQVALLIYALVGVFRALGQG